jgi:hypothetical protein
MSRLVVDREPTGDVRSIKRRYSGTEALAVLCFLLVLFVSGLGILLGDWDAPKGRDLMFSLGLPLLGPILVLLAYKLIIGRPIDRVIADREGVRFRPYSELGKVPWRDIDDFHYGQSKDWLMGKRVLFARLRAEETYRGKLHWNSPYAPGKRDALPFATVEGDHGLDLRKLKASLEQLQVQMLRDRPFTAEAGTSHHA